MPVRSLKPAPSERSERAAGRALDDPEVQALHRKVDQLAILEPAAIFALHLLTHRVLEAARQRMKADLTDATYAALERCQEGGA